MSSRHQAREVAFQFVYRYDLESPEARPDGTQLKQDLAAHFEHFKVKPKLQEFAQSLVLGTLETLEQIDEEIEKTSEKWKVERMQSVDRTLLRLGVYELGRFPDIPAPVTISEALALAKQFGSEDTPAFVNGVLDAIAKNRR